MVQMEPGTSSVRSTPPVYLLDPDRVDFYWQNIVPLLESIPIFSALYSPEWVYSEVKMGHLQLWALADDEIRAIVVTRIGVYPRAKVFEILGTAGQKAYKFVPDMEAVFEWIARDAECNYFRTTVREGVVRKLRKVDGVENVGIVLMKKIIPSRAN